MSESKDSPKDTQSQMKGSMTVQEAGRKGGEKVAHDRGPAFYAEIGRKGGEAVSKDRSHMAEIGKKGGEAFHQKRGQHGHDHLSKEEEDVEKKSA